MGEISNILKNYSQKDIVRFHMPGNKGKAELLGMPDISADITELSFTDNLYSPDADTGLIHGLEEKISRCFFPERDDVHSIISCGGATLCIQAALLAAARLHSKGEPKFLICDRASHISLINALALLNIEPLWIYPARNKSFAECVGELARTYNGAAIGVFVTSPDYYGVLKDIKSIADECEKYSLLLIADNSHGSHLAFHSGSTLHAINAGADISVDSVHKTLPALTGAALLHANKKFDKETLLRSSMRMFASTSPSFLILQSIDAMTDYLSERGREEHKTLLENINQFRREAESVGFCFDNFVSVYISGLSDPYRIVLRLNQNFSGNSINNTNDTSNGKILYDYLFSKNIVCEFFDGESVILIPSIFNTKNDFAILLNALRQFAVEYDLTSSTSFDSSENNSVPHNPRKFLEKPPAAVMTLNKTLQMPRQRIRSSDTAGKISAEAVTVYPPGIPIILPGELIDENAVESIIRLREYVDVININ